MGTLSPMMVQYFQIKEQHKDHVLFFRLGDFYEMFFEDALNISKELELTLTARDCGMQERAPMCGVPFHSVETYIAKLIQKGYKVAICEQVEAASSAVKGIVKREVVRVITPGTLVETDLLDESRNNYIACIYCGDAHSGIVFADVSTGDIQATQITSNLETKLIHEISRFSPKEIICNANLLEHKQVLNFIKSNNKCLFDKVENTVFEQNIANDTVQKQFGLLINELNLTDKADIVCALGGLIDYLSKTQFQGLERLNRLHVYNHEQFINLGISTKRNLELTETMLTKEKKGSLLWVIDKTKTPMGKRLIRSYLEKPLLNSVIIEKRLNSVEELYRDPILLDGILVALNGIYDIERIMTKIVYGNVNPKEILSLCGAIEKFPVIKKALYGVKSIYLNEIEKELDEMQDIQTLIQKAICDDAPISVKDGAVIKENFNEQLDEYRNLVTNTKTFLAEIERREKENTGIKTLKIGYNRIFGYYIEVTRMNSDLVPPSYIRKQTLANCERYITEELKLLEEKILTASHEILELETTIFQSIRKQIAVQLHRIQSSASAVAKLDVFASFANIAVRYQYSKPIITNSHTISIKEGRHPVVEQLLNDSPFITNDVLLDCDENQIAMITGPNMAGKSTYMRQVALCVLMAQIGCFVPALEATIGIVDGIYTRVGASDDLASGQSTFMVEMTEVSEILKSSTANSLLILDEIGRGTSTFDGMSIARAVVEYIADKKKNGAKTLFATHYHELTEMENDSECVKNYNIAVKKRGDGITFLRKIVRGGADDSYGIEVSELAGIPDSIIKRAYEILEKLESGSAVLPKKTISNIPQEVDYQTTLTVKTVKSPIELQIENLDVNILTPIEALNKLYELKRMCK